MEISSASQSHSFQGRKLQTSLPLKTYIPAERQRQRQRDMEFSHRVPLQHFLLVLGLMMVLLATQVVSQAKPNCEQTCGPLSIPYPFGTTIDCAYNHSFLIFCNHTFQPQPKPFLQSTLEVLNINLHHGEIHLLNHLSSTCFTDADYQTEVVFSPNFTLAPFHLSYTRNLLTTVGCSSVSILINPAGDYQTGCISQCTTPETIFNGSCSPGRGCCQAKIPPQLQNFQVMVTFAYLTEQNIRGAHCNYGFVVGEDEYEFSSLDIDSMQNKTSFPMVVDWAIGNVSCNDAMKNVSSYGCVAKYSKCIDSFNGTGYRCNCTEGFDGSPYLHDGCQDIDECARPELNQCPENSHCLNDNGGYSCPCDKGYHRDGDECVHFPLMFPLTLGLAGAISVLIVASSWSFFIYKRRKYIKHKKEFFKKNGGFILQQKLSSPELSTNDRQMVKIFTQEELADATNNYDETRIAGKGGYGTVYQGTLPNGQLIAVKKSKIMDGNQTSQFINEVLVLSQINHRNVVRLLGCCLETEVPLLVYEFINNGTLFDHIHHKKHSSSPMPWDIRLKIASETAGVLSYLHSSASVPIVHRDIKSTNILLDKHYTAKVSDFGASKLVPIDQMQLSTMVQGTLGYLDPEYLQTSQLTEKSDVYSFGVLLVELLTAKKVVSFDRPEEERNLSMVFLTALKQGRLLRIIEDGMVNDSNAKQVKEVASLAKRCLRVKGDERPSMKEVAVELERLLAVNHPWVSHESHSEEAQSFIDMVDGIPPLSMVWDQILMLNK